MALALGSKVKAHSRTPQTGYRGKQGIIISVDLDIPQADGTSADVYLVDFPSIGKYELMLGDFYALPTDDLRHL